VQSGQERLREAQKHGFTRAIIPKANSPKISMDIEVIAVQSVQDALRQIRIMGNENIACI
jgi:DNA repair protein RadA/Sms